MRAIFRSIRRLTIAGGFAAVVAAPLVAAVVSAPSGIPVHLANCANGEEGDLYTGSCVPYLVPNSPAGASACPAGVSGAECNVQSQPISEGPQMPAPVPPQEPEQELAEVVTPGY